jgi:hypothetical protein
MTDTVTPEREFGDKGGMSMVGWTVAILIGLLFLPVLPFVLLIIVILRLAGYGEIPS